MISDRPYVPPYPGTGHAIRIINAVRTRLPKLTHMIEALLMVRIHERFSDMTWTPLLRMPSSPDRPVVRVEGAREALPELLIAGGDAFAVVGGLPYRVTSKHEGFRTAGDVLRGRTYRSYDEYLDHQASKLEQRAAFVHGSSEKRYRHMRERFGEIAAAAQLSGTALCLGARLGEEVRAFRNLGLVAIGIDLNPGEQNPYCIYGDFHHLQFPDNVFDLVYSNTLDHVLDLDKFMKEAVRVTKPTGSIYFDLSGGFEETGALDPYGALFWTTNAALIEALRPYVGQIVLDRQPTGKPSRQFVFHPKK